MYPAVTMQAVTATIIFGLLLVAGILLKAGEKGWAAGSAVGALAVLVMYMSYEVSQSQ